MIHLSHSNGRAVRIALAVVLAAALFTPLHAEVPESSGDQAAPSSVTINVDDGAVVVDPDDGECSLTEAIMAANDDASINGAPGNGECEAGSGFDTIVLPEDSEFNFDGESPEPFEDTSGTITLISALPPIASDVRLEGNGSTIERTADDDMSFGLVIVQWSAHLRMSDIRLRSGFVDFTDQGGAIEVRGTLTLRGGEIVNNKSLSGGGVSVGIGSSAYISDTLIADNTSSSTGGGGLLNIGHLELSNCVVAGNFGESYSILGSRSNFGGGGLRNFGVSSTSKGFARIEDCIFRDNELEATDSDGVNRGGVAIRNGGGVLEVVDSSFHGNEGEAGVSVISASSPTSVKRTAVYNNGLNGLRFDDMADGILPFDVETPTITNTTISGNDGAGIKITQSNIELKHVTIAGNGQQGLVFTSIQEFGAPGGTIIIFENSLLTDNAGGDCEQDIAPDGPNNVDPDVRATGLSFDGDGTCDQIVNNDDDAGFDFDSNSALLASLASDNGAPPTRALQPGNPAIDAGVSSCNQIGDQRLFLRSDGACDSGAFEVDGEQRGFDYGDAPVNYPVLSVDGGARHLDSQAGAILGILFTDESDGQPGPNADGDDSDGGVTLPDRLVIGQNAAIDISVTSADSRINGWIDFNRNGDWRDPGEQIFDDFDPPETVNEGLSVPIPASAEPGPTYARFRVSTAGGDEPTGTALDGEVEDYVVTVGTEADVAITKTGPASATAGGQVTYILEATNTGPSDAEMVSIADPAPAGTTFASATAPCSGGLPCDLGTLAADESVSFEVTFDIDPSTSGDITNTASVSTTTTDPDTSNDDASVTTTVGAETDVAITKAGPASATAGGQVIYVLEVTNTGPSDAQTVSVADPAPAGTSFASATAPCSGGLPCDLGTLATDESVSFEVTFDIDPSTSGDITNTASVSTTTPDPDQTNDDASVTTTLGAEADLSLNMSIESNNVERGQTAVYTLQVANAGPSNATGVVVTDNLPSGQSLVMSDGCAEDPDGAPTCTLGSVAAGGSATIELTVQISSMEQQQTNSASVDAGVTDPVDTNNAGSVEVFVAFAVATLNGWALLLLAVVLGCLGFVVLHRVG